MYFSAKLQNTRPLLCFMSLNNKGAYCVIPRSLKPSDKCEWGGQLQLLYRESDVIKVLVSTKYNIID